MFYLQSLYLLQKINKYSSLRNPMPKNQRTKIENVRRLQTTTIISVNNTASLTSSLPHHPILLSLKIIATTRRTHRDREVVTTTHFHPTASFFIFIDVVARRRSPIVIHISAAPRFYEPSRSIRPGCMYTSIYVHRSRPSYTHPHRERIQTSARVTTSSRGP